MNPVSQRQTVPGPKPGRDLRNLGRKTQGRGALRHGVYTEMGASTPLSAG